MFVARLKYAIYFCDWCICWFHKETFSKMESDAWLFLLTMYMYLCVHIWEMEIVTALGTFMESCSRMQIILKVQFPHKDFSKYFFMCFLNAMFRFTKPCIVLPEGADMLINHISVPEQFILTHLQFCTCGLFRPFRVYRCNSHSDQPLCPN